MLPAHDMSRTVGSKCHVSHLHNMNTYLRVHKASVQSSHDFVEDFVPKLHKGLQNREFRDSPFLCPAWREKESHFVVFEKGTKIFEGDTTRRWFL